MLVAITGSYLAAIDNGASLFRATHIPALVYVTTRIRSSSAASRCARAPQSPDPALGSRDPPWSHRTAARSLRLTDYHRPDSNGGLRPRMAPGV
jgi:hypothetical protein